MSCEIRKMFLRAELLVGIVILLGTTYLGSFIHNNDL